VDHMDPSDLLAQASKLGPVEAVPFSVLQVNQNCQDEENHYAGQNALLIH